MKTPYFFGLILYLGLNSSCCKKTSTIPATIEDKTNLNLNEAELIKAAAPFKNMLGINGFEWEYIKGNGSNQLDNDKVGLISTFSGFRHYLDWEKIEPKEGVFNLNFYDQIYQKNKELGIQSLICLQIMPGWMRTTYSDYNPSDPTTVYGITHPFRKEVTKQCLYPMCLWLRQGINLQPDMEQIPILIRT